MTDLLNSVLAVTLTRLVEKNVHVGQVIEAATQWADDQGSARMADAAGQVGRDE